MSPSATLDQAADLEKLLLAHNVHVFGYERLDHLAIIRFQMNGQKLRLIVAMPDWNDESYDVTPHGRRRAVTAKRQLYWADVRKKWSAMRNLISAKLDGIEHGITTFETEFRQFEDAEALIGPGNGGS
jgi:hypothetical protein